MNILQSHIEETNVPPIQRFSVKSVCMHAGFIYGDQTTGSYVISIKKGKPLVGWVTGGSAPCITLFKPIELFRKSGPIETDKEQALLSWLQREQIHRNLMKASPSLLRDYKQEKSTLQDEIFTLYEERNFSQAWELEATFIRSYHKKLSHLSNRNVRGNLYYNYYWKKQNKRLYRKHANYFAEIN